MDFTSNASSSDSDHSNASTSFSEQQKDMRSETEKKRDGSIDGRDYRTTAIPYVPLQPEVMEYLCWSNDPNDLYLETYFDPKNPNMINAYNVEGLKPVVREKDSDTFILQDAKKQFYLWDAWEGELLRVTDDWTAGFESNEQVVENLIVYMSGVERDAVPIYQNRD
ncbi:hypothetical protein BDU57DRAFT_551852 [Ampelomyces quisqualis]|uniref:Uncharacterized protein n=1 Tax=Ampelomyces quisqualis TaxID=50730 RepID=A0A6A5Q8N8_AMPQU|nr:hypothetical protein BDU57DRAFT_551852 [Ampelomyces quisqualis]